MGIRRVVSWGVDLYLLAICFVVSALLFHFSRQPGRTAGTTGSDSQVAVSVTVERALLKLTSLKASDANATIIVFVDEACTFCIASMPFYKELAAARGRGQRLVAVAPQAEAQITAFFGKHDVPVDIAVSADLPYLGIAGTPTVALIDRNGSGTGRMGGPAFASK